MAITEVVRVVASLIGLVALYFILIHPRYRKHDRQAVPMQKSDSVYTAESEWLVTGVWHVMARYHQTEARTEHLLWTILSAPGEHLAKILQLLPLNLVAARAQVETIVSGFPQQRLWAVFNEPWVSPELRAALQQAKVEATQAGAEQIAPEHLLLALTRINPSSETERAGLTGQILRDLGITSASLLDCIRQLNQGATGAGVESSSQPKGDG